MLTRMLEYEQLDEEEELELQRLRNYARQVRALAMDAAGCWRMLTYADVCWRMLTYADVC